MAVYELRSLTREKHRGSHEVVYFAPTTFCRVVNDPLVPLRVGGRSRGNFGLKAAGSNTVYMDVVLGELIAVRLGKTGYPVL
jgi:hypothetical protein